MSISIHAPSRERPDVQRYNDGGTVISIHAPSRERPYRREHQSHNNAISIHAPSRERPHINKTDNITIFNFNPRSLAGATPMSMYIDCKQRFQSTLPRGSDPMPQGWAAFSYVAFQSTLPRGSDALKAQSASNTSISIHAPSRERLVPCDCCQELFIFQSTLPRGSDPSTDTFRLRLQVFQSTLPRGSDMNAPRVVVHVILFQSTLPRGSDTFQTMGNKVHSHFNPRSLAGATIYRHSIQQ